MVEKNQWIAWVAVLALVIAVVALVVVLKGGVTGEAVFGPRTINANSCNADANCEVGKIEAATYLGAHSMETTFLKAAGIMVDKEVVTHLESTFMIIDTTDRTPEWINGSYYLCMKPINKVDKKASIYYSLKPCR
ncbi:hypothetical protein J4474_01000 [Candidatus Pacearchaeota archaeon]|nr:hypothetical protein [Candidatus Pacearchaeota archaeon]